VDRFIQRVKNGTCQRSKTFLEEIENCGKWEGTDIAPIFFTQTFRNEISNFYNRDGTLNHTEPRITKKRCYSFNDKKFYKDNSFLNRQFVPFLYFYPKIFLMILYGLQFLIIIGALWIPENIRGFYLLIAKKQVSIWRYLFSIKFQMIFLMLLMNAASIFIFLLSYFIFMDSNELFYVFVTQISFISTIFMQMTYIWIHNSTKPPKEGPNVLYKTTA
jgi:hypothetical protein